MQQKFYSLDHTAEVLENYRRIEEHNLFAKYLHVEREKSAALKIESQKIENLLSSDRLKQKRQFYSLFSFVEWMGGQEKLRLLGKSNPDNEGIRERGDDYDEYRKDIESKLRTYPQIEQEILAIGAPDDYFASEYNKN